MSTPHVVIHGLGTIGQAVTAVLLSRGLRCHGVEVDAAARHTVLAGCPGSAEPGLSDAILSGLASNRLAVDPTPVPAPVHLLCVPTPLQPDHTADLSALEQAVAALLPQLRGGDLVIIESTVPPGTLGRLAERSGRDDVLWAVAPERLLPSRALAELRTLPRGVGGLDAAATRAAAAFYREAFGVEVHPTDAVTATCVKLALGKAATRAQLDA